MTRDLTTEEIAAMKRWRTKKGNLWRTKLMEAWQTGDYRLQDSDDVAILQHLRNDLGPWWLAFVKF